MNQHRDIARRSTGWSTMAAMAVVLIAALMRIYHLAQWPLEGDEALTLRDSLKTDAIRGPKPLLFLLNHYLILPRTELNEWSLRLLPVAFGIVSVAVLYLLCRRVVNERAGVIAALLLTVNSLHLYWSQNARYYTLIFLLSELLTLSFFIGVQERRTSWIILGIISSVLGVLAHPSAAVLIVGISVWAFCSLAGPAWRGLRAPGRYVAVALAVILVFAAVGVLLSQLPVLRQWYRLGEKWGIGSIPLVLSFVDSLSTDIFLFGGAGVLWLWHSGQRSLAGLLVATTCIPILALAGMANWVSVSTAYLFATAPFFFLGAGYFIDRLAAAGNGRGIERFAALMCLVAMLANAAPKVLSHYRDGDRADLRAAARFVAARMAEGDKVFADQPWTVKYYLRGTKIEDFPRHDPPDLESARRDLDAADPRGTLWIIVAIKRRGGFNETDLGAATDWMRANCRLVASFAKPRMDYKFNAAEVYQCGSSGTDIGSPRPTGL